MKIPLVFLVSTLLAQISFTAAEAEPVWARVNEGRLIEPNWEPRLFAKVGANQTETFSPNNEK